MPTALGPKANEEICIKLAERVRELQDIIAILKGYLRKCIMLNDQSTSLLAEVDKMTNIF